MKVLQVLYSGLGGHGSVVTSLIDADKENEWEHCLLFYGVEKVLPAYISFCHKRNLAYTSITKRKKILHIGFQAVNAALKKHSPDVVILHSPNLIFFSIWWYGRLRKKKVYVVEHTSNDVKGFVELVNSFFSLLLARKVVYLSSLYQEQMKRKFWFIPVRKRSTVIQNGIDLQKFHSIAKVEKENELHCGMIGRFLLPKNQRMIIEAVEKGMTSGFIRQKIFIHFAGNGGSIEELKGIVKEKKMEEIVKFHGLLDENEIILFFEKLDFYVHTSYAETMCTSVMQAMACGLPVLASNIPGIYNIVQEKDNALLFENDDINGLVQALLAMQDKATRLKMGASARQYAVKNFSSVDTFKKYNILIK